MLGIDEITLRLNDVTTPDVLQAFVHRGIRWNDVHIAALPDNFPVRQRRRMFVPRVVPAGALTDLDAVEYGLVGHRSPTECKVHRRKIRCVTPTVVFA